MAAAKSEHAGHRQRMKKKFLENGIDTFEQHEILEILLYHSIPMKDTNLIAHKLINKFGSLSAVLDAPYDLLLEQPGISESTAFLLKFLPEVMGIYRNDKIKNKSKVLERDVIPEMLINKFFGKKTEMTYLILMNANFKELYSGIISKGTILNTELNIPKICELAVRYSARYAIISHNHPSGSTLPSRADIIATINLYQALFSLKVTLLDHFVVADDDCVSFYEANILFKSMAEFERSPFYNNPMFS